MEPACFAAANEEKSRRGRWLKPPSRSGWHQEEFLVGLGWAAHSAQDGAVEAEQSQVLTQPEGEHKEMRYQDYQFRQGRGMLFACSSSPSGLAKSKHEDVYAGLENVTEISKHRNKARGSKFSTRKTGHSTGWLFSESSWRQGSVQVTCKSWGHCPGMCTEHCCLHTCPRCPHTALVRQNQLCLVFKGVQW